MTNALLDLMLKNGAVSFYDNGGEELEVAMTYFGFPAHKLYCLYKGSDALYKGSADGLLAFLQEVCL